MTPLRVERIHRRPAGLVALVLFFAFGATMAGLSFLSLLFPRTLLSGIWRVNPSGHVALLAMGPWALVLMAAVSAGCASAAYGLWRGAGWGRLLASGILVANLAGDTGQAVFAGDLRTLIGLPIGGAMIAYLWSRRVRAHFEGRR